ncbi:MAG: twin-arginine translocase subunit TatC [Proteobacteria bacterium]|nr:twin-arginine translocase subunit TatC [Pseudomonadota bacterium]
MIKKEATEATSSGEGLFSHLIELRNCLMRIVIALLLLMFSIFPFSGKLYSLLAQPMIDELAATAQKSELVAIGVLSPFIIQITTSFFFAFWIGLPYVLFEVWRFVAPGLYKHEKRLVLPLIVSSSLLFSLGMAFAYFLVFKVVFSFIAQMTPEGVNWTPDISEYFSFMIKIFLGFGLAFETPVVVYLLARCGIADVHSMRRARPYVIVGAFVLAAIITPPDVISQFMLAIPCWLLFEIGLLLAPKPQKTDEDTDDDSEESEETDTAESK